MADLAASIATARKSGYSDAEIAAYIANDPGMGPKLKAARQHGYSDAEIVAHLGKVNGLKDTAKSFGSGVMEGVAGLADTMAEASPLGLVDSALKTAAGVAETIRGRPNTRISSPFSGNSDAVAKARYQPMTTGGEYARTIGQNLPNGLAPGSLPTRAVNIFAPALASETAGQVARSSGAGPSGEMAARAVGGLTGAAVASLRPQNIFDRRPAATPTEAVGTRGRQDPGQMRTRAQQLRQAGVDPTLTDVVDDTGRGMIRAAANRQTPGRQVANDFSRNRTLNLPDRMSRQARRTVSPDPRTPDQIRAEMTAQRGANADRAFGAVRADTVQLSPEGVQALRTDYGRAAITEAARRERDPEIRAALNRLATDALDNPSTPITVGMADRISRVLLGQAQAAGGDRDLAGTLNGLGRAIRGPAAEASPGYADALEGYGADTRLTEAAGVGEGLMRHNTDEFAQAAGRLSDEERQLALAAGRRTVERAAGENPSSAPGVARRLADAPEQQVRNAALMGPQRAGDFQDAMRAEVQAVENANAIAPRAGSSTFLNQDDGANLRNAAGIAGDVARGRVANLGMRALEWAYTRWRTRGMGDDQIEHLVRLAVDPNQTDAAINAIAARLQPQQRQEFLSIRNAALVGAASTTTGARRATPEERQ